MTTDHPGTRPDSNTAALPTAASSRWSFTLLAIVGTVFLAASSAPTPLYRVFQTEMRLSAIMITAIFAIYALTLLIALLTVGSLSDHVGRRPVIIGAIVLEIGAMLIFINAGSANDLLLARALQGFATGAVTTALAAGLTDLSRVRGQYVNGISPLLGMAAGALAAAGVATAVSAPVPVVFWGLVVILAMLLVAVPTTTETAEKRPGALASLRVRLNVPTASRAALLTALPVLVAGWAICGFVLSLGPALASEMSGSAHPSPMIGGAFVATMMGCGALAVALLARVAPARVLAGGATGLAIGVTLIILATPIHSFVTLFAGAVVAGLGAGAGFQGALLTVMPTAPIAQRASFAATVYSIGYLSMSVPAVAAGGLTSGWGVDSAAVGVGGFVILLTLSALAVMGRRAARRLRELRHASH